MNKSRVIAELPGYAQVQVCDAGCGHITFPPVTLHFPNQAEMKTTIHAFLAQVAPHLPESGDGDSCVELAYGPVSLYLAPTQAQDLMTLLGQAEQALATPIPEAVPSGLRPHRFAVARGDAARGAGEA